MRDLRAKVKQPEQYLREVLNDIAFMHKQGDFNGRWELKQEYKAADSDLLNPNSIVAPKLEDSDMDGSGVEDEGDDDVQFEDV